MVTQTCESDELGGSRANRDSKLDVAASKSFPRSERKSIREMDALATRRSRSVQTTAVPRLVRNVYATTVRFVPVREVTGGTVPSDMVLLARRIPDASIVLDGPPRLAAGRRQAWNVGWRPKASRRNLPFFWPASITGHTVRRATCADTAETVLWATTGLSRSTRRDGITWTEGHLDFARGRSLGLEL